MSQYPSFPIPPGVVDAPDPRDLHRSPTEAQAAELERLTPHGDGDHSVQQHVTDGGECWCEPEVVRVEGRTPQGLADDEADAQRAIDGYLREWPPLEETRVTGEDIAAIDAQFGNPKAAQALRDGKAPLDLIEHAAEVEIARVMKHGADRYGRRNYVHPDTEILATTYVAAIRRHAGAIAAGEEVDPDSGFSHWAHIGANINVVLAAIAAGTFVNDLAVAVTELSAISNARHSGS